MTTHDVVELKKQIDGKVMHDYLFAMATDYASGKIKPTETDAKVKELLSKFVGGDKTVATSR